jgi:hypothetical protein
MESALPSHSAFSCPCPCLLLEYHSPALHLLSLQLRTLCLLFPTLEVPTVGGQLLNFMGSQIIWPSLKGHNLTSTELWSCHCRPSQGLRSFVAPPASPRKPVCQGHPVFLSDWEQEATPPLQQGYGGHPTTETLSWRSFQEAKPKSDWPGLRRKLVWRPPFKMWTRAFLACIRDIAATVLTHSDLST